MSWFFRIVFALLAVLVIVLLLNPDTARADSTNDAFSKESKLRAAYFLNFIKFINWPNHSQDNPLTPLYICLQDETPFEGFFRDLASNAAMADDGRELQIYRLSEAIRCDYTYLHRPIQNENSEIEGSVVVLSSDQVSQQDAAIIFYIAERKLRFEIDLNNIKELNVMVSSELLKLARIK
ncbi:MAG: YfiR family protein [Halioglobus sp.]|jgi:hypothetical protein|nr:YfiR family protein [Halioglobus sp.]